MLSLQALIVKLTLSIPTLTVSVSPQPDKSQTEIGLLSFLPKGISISHSAIGRPNNRLHNELLGLHYILYQFVTVDLQDSEFIAQEMQQTRKLLSLMVLPLFQWLASTYQLHAAGSQQLETSGSICAAVLGKTSPHTLRLTDDDLSQHVCQWELGLCQCVTMRNYYFLGE